MRIRLVKDNKLGKKGDTVEVSKNVAFGLIDSGNGVLTKDIVEQDYKTKLENSKLNKNKTS